MSYEKSDNSHTLKYFTIYIIDIFDLLEMIKTNAL